MQWSASWTEGFSSEIRQRCDAYARSSAVAQYARTPARVCRALELEGVAFAREPAMNRLQAWFLFMVAADDALDRGLLEDGDRLLEQMFQPSQMPDPLAEIEVVLAEVLKAQTVDCRLPVQSALRAVWASVSWEKQASSAKEYVRARRQVGWTCSTMNYVLLRPLLANHPADLCLRWGEIGELGNLIDTLVDYPMDRWRGQIPVPPRGRLWVRTARETLGLMTAMGIRHPKMVPLFVGALGDNLTDWVRGR